MYIHSFPSHSFKRETVYTATIDPSVNNDQQPTKYIPTTKDKVIGYSSIAFCLLAFTILLYFCCSPLFRSSRRSKKHRKNREVIFEPLIIGRKDTSESSDSGSDGSSTAVDKERSIIWEPPDRVVLRDLIGLPSRSRSRSQMHQDTNTVTATAKTKALAPESSTDLDPFLSYFPAPPSGISSPNVVHPATCYPSNQTENPNSPTTGDSLNICTSVPPRSSSLHALPMSSSPKASTSNSNFVISNEEGPPRSRSGSIETINNDNDIDTGYPYNTHMYGSTPPPSSSTVKESQKPTPPSPVYADMILPRYLQPQSLINEASVNVGPNSYSVLNTTRF